MKRYFTLIELIIALILTMAVLTTLMFFYREVALIDSETEATIQKNFEERYLDTRLSSVLPSIASPKKNTRDILFLSLEGSSFSSSNCESLIFIFDNGNCLDKDFSNDVLGCLFVDGEGNLTLSYWPSPQRWPKGALPKMKKEILLKNVSQLHFEFYVAPQKSKKEKPFPLPEGWNQQAWSAELKSLPAMIRLNIVVGKDKKKLTVAFPLVRSTQHITYEKEDS